MKNSLFLPLIVGALALTSCSTPTKVDSGPVRASTFSFINPGPTPQFASQAQVVHTSIQQAITRNLAARGITKVDAAGDVTVGYLLITGNNVSTQFIDTYFGYREDTSKLQEHAHQAYTQRENPNYFEAGTLVIDIINSKDNSLLSRGHATRPILRTATDAERAARIQEVVDEILRSVKWSADLDNSQGQNPSRRLAGSSVNPMTLP